MIARGLRPDDVILMPPGEDWWWVKHSRPVDPARSLDGPWRLGLERLTGLEAHDPTVIAAADVHPDTEFPLVGGEP